MTKDFLERVLNNTYTTVEQYDRYIKVTSDVNSDGTPDIVQTIANNDLLRYYQHFAVKYDFYDSITWDIPIVDTKELKQIFNEVELYSITNNI